MPGLNNFIACFTIIVYSYNLDVYMMYLTCTFTFSACGGSINYYYYYSQTNGKHFSLPKARRGQLLNLTLYR